MKVLKSLEDKANKAVLKNTTTATEAKKRKGVGRARSRRLELPLLSPSLFLVRRW